MISIWKNSIHVLLKYLGILVDLLFNWKKQVEFIGNKIRRSIGISFKIRCFVDLSILVKILIYPFLAYGMIFFIWGNTYETTLEPVFIIQKKAMHIVTFSLFDNNPSPLFKVL